MCRVLLLLLACSAAAELKYVTSNEIHQASMPKREQSEICKRLLTGKGLQDKKAYIPAYRSHEKFGVCTSGDFQPRKMIGKGGFGVVYQGVHFKTGTVVTLKYISLKGIRLQRSYATEQAMPQDVNREECMQNLVSLPTIREHYCSYFNVLSNEAVLVMEYVDGTPLSSFYRSSSAFASLPVVAAKLVITLQAMHGHNLIYSDLKPENILLTPAGEVKLIDFGLVQWVDTNLAEANGAVGTPLSWPPEYFPQSAAQEYNSPMADWWGLAMVLHRVITDTLHPFKIEDFEDEPVEQQMEILGALMQQELPVHASLPEREPAFVDFFKTMTALEKSKRQGYNSNTAIADIMSHPWFAAVPDLRPFFLRQ